MSNAEKPTITKTQFLSFVKITNRIEENDRKIETSLMNQIDIYKDQLDKSRTYCRAFRTILMTIASKADCKLSGEQEQAYIELCNTTGTPITPEERKALHIGK